MNENFILNYGITKHIFHIDCDDEKFNKKLLDKNRILDFCSNYDDAFLIIKEIERNPCFEIRYQFNQNLYQEVYSREFKERSVMISREYSLFYLKPIDICRAALITLGVIKND